MWLKRSSRAVAEIRRQSLWLATVMMIPPVCFLGLVLASQPAPEKKIQAPGGPAAASTHPLLIPTNKLLIAVAPPPFSEGVFPCSECHDGKDVNTKRRVVEDHEQVVLEHDKENRWCLDCHDTVNRDKLHLADGRLLDFTESYLLCGQCHGPTLRNWRAGEHGKRTGSWNGQKQYLLCVSCHNPHSPKFKPLKPMPPPVRQEALR